MPTQLPPREPTNAQLLIQCGRYFAGIAILLVAVVLMPQRGSENASAAARPYFLDEIRPLSVTVPGCRRSGQSGIPLFVDSVSVRILMLRTYR